MRKFLTICVAVFAIMLSCLFSCNIVGSNFSNAQALDASVNIRQNVFANLEKFIDRNNSTKLFVNRLAGTKGELAAAEHIKTILLEYGLEPKTNSSTQDGMQEFSFVSDYYNKKAASQNVIYTLKGKTSDKKIVLTSAYDNYYDLYLDSDNFIYQQQTGDVRTYSEGINASAASVAVLLSLAEILPQNFYDFDIEFVFLGASYSSDSGAKYYSSTMSSEEMANTLLMIDVSKIALGKDVYYYTGEFGSKQDAYYASQLSNLVKYSTGLAGSSVAADNFLGYENAGYSGATAVFADNGLNIVHLFAGSYDTGMFAGFLEYHNSLNVINGKFDNLEDILQTREVDLADNLAIATESLFNLINDENLISQMSVKNSNASYKFFTNYKLISIITIVLVFVLMIISVVIQYYLKKKAYAFMLSNNLNGVMLEIDDGTEKTKNQSDNTDATPNGADQSISDN